MEQDHVVKQNHTKQRPPAGGGAETNLSAGLSGLRSWVGHHGGPSGQTGALAHLTEDAAALVEHRAALALPLCRRQTQKTILLLPSSRPAARPSLCHVAPMTPDSPVLGDDGSEVRLSCRRDAAMASRGRSQVVHRTARISLTVVQWEHSHGDRDGLEEHRQLKDEQLQA